jgi:urease accessory protein
MPQLTEIIGFAAEPELAERLHDVSHRGGIEYLRIPPQDIGRRRLRITGDRGTDCAIALARDARLADGAVLLLEHDRAIVVRLGEQAWLRLRPADAAAAVELGYNAGNLHWKVKFDGAELLVAQDGPPALYTARLQPLLQSGRVSVVDDA